MTTTHIVLILAALICIAISLSCIIIGLLNKRLAGNILMDIGWLHKNGFFFTLFLAVTIFISNMLVRAFNPEILGLFEIIIAFVCILLGMTYFFRSGLSNLEIRENGIVDFWLFLRWDEIESYEWKGSTLSIRFRRVIPLKVSWYVPVMYKDNFEYTIQNHVFSDYRLMEK